MKKSKQKTVEGGVGVQSNTRKIKEEENKQLRPPAPRANKTTCTTLRAKPLQPWVEPSARPCSLRALDRLTSREPRGKIPDFITDSARLPPMTIYPSLLKELRRQARSPVQPVSSPKKISTVNKRFTAGDESREEQKCIYNGPERPTSSPIISPADTGGEEQIEGTPSNSNMLDPLSRPEIHFIKLEERLIDHQCAITQEELNEQHSRPTNPDSPSVKFANNRHKVQFQGKASVAEPNGVLSRTSKEKLQQPKPRGILKDALPSNIVLSDKSNRMKPLVIVGETPKLDLDSKIRASTPRLHKNTPHGSSKSVAHRLELEYGDSSAVTSNHIDELERNNRKLILENDFRRFLLAVRGMKRCSARLLNPLLEALNELKSDEDYESDMGLPDTADTERAIENVETEIQPTSDAIDVHIDLPAERKVVLASTAADGATLENIDARGQQSYHDVLIQSPVKSSGARKQERSIGQELPLDPGSRLVKKLDPTAPVFQSLLRKDEAEISADPVEKQYQCDSTFRAEQPIYMHENPLKRDISTRARVGKYVPPALRGDRNRQSPTKSQEPIWMKTTADNPQMKSAEPGITEMDHTFLQTDVNDAAIPKNPQQLSSGYEDHESHQERIRKWVHDAAKPDYGLETHYIADYGQKLAEVNPNYSYATNDIAWTNPGYEESMPFALGQLPPLPMHWGPVNPHLMQNPNLQAGYPMLPFPLVGPLIPLPGPPFLMDQVYQEPALQQLPEPLIPIHATKIQGVPRNGYSKEENAARIARSLDPAWRDRVLDRFASRFPMTGKAQANFPVPPIQDLESQAAQIQQKLELLILQDKEKKAAEKWLKSCQRNRAGSIPRVSTSSSENLIKFE